MNDIEHYIPSKQSVIVGQMTQHEAVTLLTSGVIDSSQLSQEGVSLLDELAQDVHLWPLLLSLIRGQLSYNLKQYHLSNHEAIQNIQVKLHHKDLTAFDKNNIEAIAKSRKFAMKACIDTTLDLIIKSLSDSIKILMLWTGIGTSLQTAVLSILWKTSKQEAEDTVGLLWAYGLVQFTDTRVYPTNITQQCVEVHAVIGQYIIESMQSIEIIILSPYSDKLNTAKSVANALAFTFHNSYGVHDISLLNAVDYLKYKQTVIGNLVLQFYLRKINMHTVSDPHSLMLKLARTEKDLIKSVQIKSLVSSLSEEINSLISNCKQVLKSYMQKIKPKSRKKSIQKRL